VPGVRRIERAAIKANARARRKGGQDRHWDD
jgi:hypothetical protein